MVVGKSNVDQNFRRRTDSTEGFELQSAPFLQASSVVMIVLGPEGWPCKREREPSSQEGCARPVQKQRDRCASLTALRVGCVCSARKEARTAINKTASCTCGPWLPPSSSPATKLAPARRTTAKPTPLLPLWPVLPALSPPDPVAAGICFLCERCDAPWDQGTSNVCWDGSLWTSLHALAKQQRPSATLLLLINN